MNKPEFFKNSLPARLLLVFLAFALMVVSSGFVMYYTLNRKLLQNAESAMDDTQVLFSRILSEPETVLELIAGNIEELYDINESFDDIKAYMAQRTAQQFQDRTGILSNFSIFGHFNTGTGYDEVFFDGSGWQPVEAYDPKELPWHTAAAAASKGAVASTSPYIDKNTGLPVISYARRLFDRHGASIGIICIEVQIDNFRDMVINKKITPNSYGYMIDNNYDVIIHRSRDREGQKFWDGNSATQPFASDIRLGRDISLKKSVNYAGERSIVFGRALDNGWYFCLIVPETEYYGELYNMIILTGLLGAASAIILMLIFVRLEKAKRKSDDREIELLHARATDRLQLAKLNLVVKAAKIGLWDAPVNADDPVNENCPFMWSEEFKELLGYSEEDEFPNLIGSFTSRLHPDDLDRTNAAFAAHLLDKTGKTPFDLEYRLKKKSGEYAYFRATGETIRDEDGNPIHVAGAIMDITETKNTIIETERLRREAESANKAKSAFLNTMSHEIRTPMNAVLGITEIQLQKEDLPEDTEEALLKIYASGDMLLGIINDILDMSKIEAGKMELICNEYEVASLISDTAQLNMMRIGSKPIEFELRVDENLPAKVIGDELRVKQILNNLLSNAIKYTAEGKVIFSVYPGPSAQEDTVTVVFEVSDTGQGMNDDQLARLFDEYARFNQEANRTTEGTGLGMSITNNLIKLMGGDLRVESKPGEGSVFTVRLKQGRDGADVLGKETAENLLRFRAGSRAQMKRVQITREPMPYGSVLVVDDVESNIYVAKGLMSPYMLKIDTAESGFEAIEKIKAGNSYDIIFMDHMMPEMDGIETTEKIRDMGYKPPIVALTANAVAGQSEIFMKSGFDDFISKPIDVRQLNTVLNKLIRDKKPAETVEAARDHEKSRPEAVLLSTDPVMAEIFVRDAKKTLPVLLSVTDKGMACGEDEIRKFTIHVHGLKSALAAIGKLDLSASALKLESLGRDGNIKAIIAETPAFLRALKLLINDLSPASEDTGDNETDEDKGFLAEKLAEIKSACDALDEKTIDDIIARLHEKACSQQTNEILKSISEKLLHSDFDEAGNIAAMYAEKL